MVYSAGLSSQKSRVQIPFFPVKLESDYKENQFIKIYIYFFFREKNLHKLFFKLRHIGEALTPRTPRAYAEAGVIKTIFLFFSGGMAEWLKALVC